MIQVYLKKQEKSQINNINLYLKELEKEKQSPKLVEEIIKISVYINKMETKMTIGKINETKSSFFEKIKLLKL